MPCHTLLSYNQLPKSSGNLPPPPPSPRSYPYTLQHTTNGHSGHIAHRTFTRTSLKYPCACRLLPTSSARISARVRVGVPDTPRATRLATKGVVMVAGRLGATCLSTSRSRLIRCCSSLAQIKKRNTRRQKPTVKKKNSAKRHMHPMMESATSTKSAS